MIYEIISILLERGVTVQTETQQTPVNVILNNDGLVFEFDGGEGTINESTDFKTIEIIEELLGFNLSKGPDNDIIKRFLADRLNRLNPFSKDYFDIWNGIKAIYGGYIPDDLRDIFIENAKINDLKIYYEDQENVLGDLFFNEDYLDFIESYYYSLSEFWKLFNILKVSAPNYQQYLNELKQLTKKEKELTKEEWENLKAI